MSYILEALKKSDRTRNGSIQPHSQPRPQPMKAFAKPGALSVPQTESPPPASTKKPAWPWIIGAALLFNAAVTVYHHYYDSMKYPLREASSGNAESASRALAKPAVPEPSSLAEAATQVTPAPVQRRQTPPPKNEQLAKAAAPSQQSLQTRSGADNVEKKPAPQRTQPPKRITQETSFSANERFRNVPLINEMPLSFQQQLPRLNVDLHVFAQNPNRRFALVDMMKFREGDEVKDHLVLEEITKDGLIMNFRGKLFKLLPRR